MAVITFVDGGPVDPGYGVSGPIYGGGYPSHGLPGGPTYPSGQPIIPPGGATLPVFPFDPTDPGFGVGAGNRPDNSLPNAPARPDQGLPSSPGRPDNSLPSQPGGPSTQPIRPGAKFVVKWLACVGLILVPDNSLPGSPNRPYQGLPPAASPKG
jgi:hypothetical protein